MSREENRETTKPYIVLILLLSTYRPLPKGFRLGVYSRHIVSPSHLGVLG